MSIPKPLTDEPVAARDEIGAAELKTDSLASGLGNTQSKNSTTKASQAKEEKVQDFDDEANDTTDSSCDEANKDNDDSHKVNGKVDDAQDDEVKSGSDDPAKRTDKTPDDSHKVNGKVDDAQDDKVKSGSDDPAKRADKSSEKSPVKATKDESTSHHKPAGTSKEKKPKAKSSKAKKAPTTKTPAGKSEDPGFDEIQNLKTIDPFAEAVDETGDQKDLKKIHIRIQQRNGRKTLTTVQGINPKFKYEKLLRYMRKNFACNGTIVKSTGLGDFEGDVIQLQGDQCTKVFDFLVSKEDGLNLDGKTISVHNWNK